ncbi:MAG TPA: recombination protein O N-terminal domain-containing protein [Candidatus Paceibacterota bacterium]|nr:recombination protein O N-terminal domain-containing protein [Candidatus Paceibacterota bacterium]
MREYLTPAVVLGSRPVGDRDRLVDLYTKDLGRLSALVVGGMMVNSKLSPHLDVGNLVDVRLVRKNRFTVTDAAIRDRLRGGNFLRDVYFVKSILPEEVPDLRLWHDLVQSLGSAKTAVRRLLKVLGYDPLLARCDACGGADVAYFYPGDQSFFCSSCPRRFGLGDSKLVNLN